MESGILGSMNNAPKNCEQCKKLMVPYYRVTKEYWDRRRFCSHACMHSGQRGQRLPTYGKHRLTLAERFWPKVSITSLSGCWLWTGATDKFGYGKIGNRSHAGGDVKSHRLSYELNVGHITDGLHVLHECDNPPCVNPNHLFLGTQIDNNADKDRKGRGPSNRGISNPRARLTPEIVAEVRRLRSEGWSQTKIANHVRFPQPSISKILRGVGWIPE